MSSMKRVTSDIALIVIVFSASVVWAFYLSSLFPIKIINEWNIWYGADLPRTASNMFDLSSNHYRTKVHPIFSFLILPPTRLLAIAINDVVLAIRIICALFSGITVTLICLFVRLQSKDMIASGVVALLAMSSSAFVYWFSVPETFLFGAATIALAFLFLVVPNLGVFQYILMSAATLSFTVTNWAAGILVTFFRWKLSYAVLITLGGFFVVLVLSLWQKAFLESSQLFFLASAISEERNYIITPWADEALTIYVQRIFNFLIYGMVSPTPTFGSSVNSGIMQFGLFGWLAVLMWLSVFVVGSVNMLKYGFQYFPVAGFIASQFLLHLIYGDEPFLYSAHSLPAFCIVASFALTSKYQVVVRVFVVALSVAMLFENYTNYVSAIALAMENIQ